MRLRIKKKGSAGAARRGQRKVSTWHSSTVTSESRTFTDVLETASSHRPSSANASAPGPPFTTTRSPTGKKIRPDRGEAHPPWPRSHHGSHPLRPDGRDRRREVGSIQQSRSGGCSRADQRRSRRPRRSSAASSRRSTPPIRSWASSCSRSSSRWLAWSGSASRLPGPTLKPRAHNRGEHMGRVAPFGYRKRPDDGRLEPDPLTAPFATKVFERRAAGVSLNEMSALAKHRACARFSRPPLHEREDQVRARERGVRRAPGQGRHALRERASAARGHPHLAGGAVGRGHAPHRANPSCLVAERSREMQFLSLCHGLGGPALFIVGGGVWGSARTPSGDSAGHRNGNKSIPAGEEPRFATKRGTRPPAWWSQLADLHSQGLTDKEIAGKVGHPVATVKAVRLRSLRLPANSKSALPRRAGGVRDQRDVGAPETAALEDRG